MTKIRPRHHLHRPPEKVINKNNFINLSHVRKSGMAFLMNHNFFIFETVPIPYHIDDFSFLCTVR